MKGGNPDISKYGEKTQFKNGHKSKGGRKPTRLKKFIKEYDVSSKDIGIIFNNLLWEYSLNDIQALSTIAKSDEKNIPMGIAILVSGLLEDVSRGDMRAFNIIMERLHGKPVQPVTADVSAGVTEMTREERQERINALLEKRDK